MADDEIQEVEDVEPGQAEGGDLPSEEAALTPEERLARLETQQQEERERHEQEKAALEERLRQTHAWGNEAHMARVASETLLRSMGQPQQQAPALQAPEVTQEDLETLLDDPKRLVGVVRNHADYAAKWALERVAPAANAALSRAATEEQEFELLADLSVERARRHFAAKGIDTAEDFDPLLSSGQVWDVLNRAAVDPRTGQVNPVALRRLALSPKAVQMAVQAIWDDQSPNSTSAGNGGNRRARNPSIGAGRRAPQRTVPTPARDEAVDALERSFKNVMPGFKFSDSDLAEAAQEARRGRR